MSITQTENTNTSFQKQSDVLTDIIGPYTKKLRLSLSFDPEGDRTSQEFKDECDIDSIVSRFNKTGQFDFVNKHAGRYGDATGHDYQMYQDQIVQANNMFADLPAKVRDRFGNDPAQFLDFIADENNALEAAKMGLLAPEKAESILNPQPKAPTAPEGSKEPAPNPE